ncbi:SIR2 family protein [uncultured Thiothrix sp.]|uniref:SIR2 family protein n=1 Tax=uncultured Thiothrix sp. TaxID=223185 RepID=UPI0026129D2B|nr:SIR2 family protein [uncultured Thiothrix sp.]HMT94929.1 SIR2 family protein [Thiolinea sp.]
MVSEDFHNASYEELVSRLNGLEDTHSREKIDEQQRLEPKIISLKQLLIKRCQQKVNRLRSINSYEAAFKKCLEIKSYHSTPTAVDQEIAELKTLIAQQDKVKQWGAQLSRFPKLRLIIKNLLTALKQVEASLSYQILVTQVEDLLLGANPYIDSFLCWWEAEYQETSPTRQLDLHLLAERIRRGEIVLFIGSGLAGLSVDDSKLATRLAQQIGYESFRGSLSSIAELYQLRPEFGQAALLRHLTAEFSQAPINLYQSLAQVPQALILISAAYDNLLEKTFSLANKRYVEVASIVKRSEHYDIGHVLLRYSDKTEPATILSREDLSKLQLLESGYSIIYKIRGTCSENLANSQDDFQYDALTLSESSYFNFARHADKIIPDYLAQRWRNRDLLFIAYRAKDWEDRLLVSALLEKRSAQKPCYVIGSQPEPLEQAYWEARNVKQYPVKLPELESCLTEVRV